MTPHEFKKTIWKYYKAEGRHDMPWRKTRDPYRILISEIMLQQTQVSRVKAFYLKFIKEFPDFQALARAKTADVLRAWQGLGYNRRALALQNLSRIVLEEFNGQLPRDRAALESLPGIGKATAGSLRAFVFDEPEIFIETNIRRVFIHFFFKRKMKVTDEALARYIESTVSGKSPREWYWALMDYGAMLGAANAKDAKGSRIANPNRKSAHYRKQSRFQGSDRELRGKVVKLLLNNKSLSVRNIVNTTGEPMPKVQKVIAALAREGFIKKNRSKVSVSS